MTDDDPAPDLQEFIRTYGDWRRMAPEHNGVYSLVTAAEWVLWDRMTAGWQARRRERYRGT